MDLPNYLRTLPNTRVELADRCPHCRQLLSGMVEADTNAVVDVECTHCGYTDNFGCPIGCKGDHDEPRD